MSEQQANTEQSVSYAYSATVHHPTGASGHSIWASLDEAWDWLRSRLTQPGATVVVTVVERKGRS